MEPVREAPRGVSISNEEVILNLFSQAWQSDASQSSLQRPSRTARLGEETTAPSRRVDEHTSKRAPTETRTSVSLAPKCTIDANRGKLPLWASRRPGVARYDVA